MQIASIVRTVGRIVRGRIAPAIAFALLPGAAEVAAHTRITTDLTWSEDIREIFRVHCMECHSPGGAAPDFVDLTTYDLGPGKSGARSWAKAIEEELLTGRMPPWGADPRFENFSNRRGLSKRELDYIVAWIQGGAPQGPERNLPPPPEFAERGWTLGEPDLVVEPAEETVVPAGTREAEAVFTHVLPEDLGVGPDGKPLEAQWLVGWEFLPEAAHVVRRARAYVLDPPSLTEDFEDVEVQKPYDPLAVEEAAEEIRPRPMPVGRRFLAQWSRGDRPVLLPDESGRKLRPGSTIEVRVEYRKFGLEDLHSEFRDRTRLGLHFAKEPPEFIVEAARLAVEPLELAPQESRDLTAFLDVPESARIVSLFPGGGGALRGLEISAAYPDGMRKTLVHVPAFETRFASSFVFAEPVEAPAGTRIEMKARVANLPPSRPTYGPKPELVPVRIGDDTPEAVDLWIDYRLDDHRFVPTPTPTPRAVASPAPGTGMVFSLPEDARDGAPRLDNLGGVFSGLMNDSEPAAPRPSPTPAPKTADLGAPAAGAEGARTAPDNVYWCPMRTSCGLKDYDGPSKCTVCGMDNIPKEEYLAELRERTGSELAARSAPWKLTKLGVKEIYWNAERGRNGDLADYPAPGVDPKTGARLIHASRFETVRTYMCLNKECVSYYHGDPGGTLFYSAGLCPDCEEPVEGQGHMDHTPVRGGLFFMAQNLYHHLEGVLESKETFKLYFYDDWKTPLDPRNFKGRIEVEEWSEADADYVYTELPLTHRAGDDFMTATLPEGLEFPIQFDAFVSLAGEETLFTFYFEELTKPPLPEGDGDATPAQIVAHKHESCPPFEVPTDAGALVATLESKRDAIRALIDADRLLDIHCDTYDARACVAGFKELIRERKIDLGVRPLAELRAALDDLTQGALQLHEYGHVGDKARTERIAYARFAKGVATLRKLFP